ncbi:uncharacterized protein LOC104879453 isoform X2 [Vitis vinifera]|uniref:uncharacterized protein LOC104879453 isoform X2 n=1 Tax=Vitis vinifera TaxID=29760 RepID=UPI0001BE4881|eukprot:XP_010650542.1 PREDICTED: uncharacterized protein LOC104879453 isoform X2 [Vitis vinifera]
MVSPDVGSVEDVVRALLEYLVDPLLPAKSSSRSTPSLSQQQSVAKQVHAVVLLYNYYHRKQHQQLEFLGFEPFCKLAVVLKPSLLSHMKLMQILKTGELDDLENHLSATEKMVMDACDISTSLNASKDVPNTEGWPISKVTVFLVDSRKENCVLLFSSVTQGVWSVIEKDVDATNHSLEGVKQIYRKKRTTKKSTRDETGSDEASLQQLAFSAVKKAAGISQADLMVLESHVVYSLSKERTACRFYIMQCTQSINEDISQIPINEAIDSLQGPLVKNSSCSWTVTSVVEYFHVLPYKGILSDWLSRGVFSNSLQDLRVGLGNEKLNSTQRTAEPLDAEVKRNSNESHSNCGRVDVLGNENMNADNPCMVCPQNEDDAEVNKKRVGSDRYLSTADVLGNKSSGTDTESPRWKYSNNESRSKSLPNSVEVNLHQKEMTLFTARDLNAAATGAMAKEGIANSVMTPCTTSCRGEKVANGGEICNFIMPDQDGMLIEDRALVTYESNSEHLDKLQITIASKEKLLSQTALKVLLRKRDRLSHQQRKLEDEIAQCDKNIQTILDGGEDDLALKIESILEFCNDACPQTRDRTYRHLEDQESPQHIKRKRLSEAILNIQKSCQELDGICYENNWILPTYRVSLLDGKSEGTVSVKGVDFEISVVGEPCDTPREARESAAAQMLAKLQSMATAAAGRF